MRRTSLAIILALLGFVQAKQNLRHQVHQRELVVTQNIPFDVTMNIEVREEAKDKTPTTDDYNGAVLGFQTWFHENSQTFYQDNPKYDVDYKSTACRWVPEKTTYDPSAASASGGFHHAVGVTCQATFSADNAADMVTSIDVAREASTSYNIQNLVSDYIAPASPANSPFQATQRMNLQLVASSTPSSGPIPTLPPAHTPAPGTTTKGAVPVTLKWTLSVQPHIQDRQPTEQEYNDFKENSEAWVRDIFVRSFDGSIDGLATFTGIRPESSEILESAWEPTTQEFPHTITVRTVAEFEKAYGEVLPDVLTYATAIRAAGVTSFRTDYLAKTPGIFQNPAYLGYQVL